MKAARLCSHPHAIPIQRLVCHNEGSRPRLHSAAAPRLGIECQSWGLRIDARVLRNYPIQARMIDRMSMFRRPFGHFGVMTTSPITGPQ